MNTDAPYNRMQEDLKLKNYAPGTQQQYVQCARRFELFHRGRSLAELGKEEVRHFLLNLALEQASPAVLKMHLASLRFLFSTTLGRPEVVVGIPWPKVPRTLPVILSGTEVERLLWAIEPLKQRAVVMTAYGAGLRISEACALHATDIDSKRRVIHVRDGKRGRDRYVMLSARLLLVLREYFRQVRPPKPYLFPGQSAQRPIAPSTVRAALKKSIEKVGVGKRVTPHTLRHAFATHLHEMGNDIRTIQALLGHASIQSTARYTQVSTAHVGRVTSPLDVLGSPKGQPLR
jgi:site-specific recombinase XerD